MASAAISIVETPATIESDSSEAVITKTAAFYTMEGYLINHGPADVWCKVSDTDTAASSVVTTGAQAQKQVPLPAGSQLEWLPSYNTVAHKTAAGTAILSWQPKRRLE